MHKENIIVPAAMLIAGAAIGFWVRPEPEPTVVLSEEEYVAKAKIDDKGDSATADALRARISELEAELKRAKEAKPQPKESSEKDAKTNENQRRFRPRVSFKEEIERIKKEEPERYAQMKARMQEVRQMHQERALERYDMLESLNTSKLSAEDKYLYDDLMNQIVKREELNEKLMDENLSEEEREQVLKDLHEVGVSTFELNRAVREALIKTVTDNSEEVMNIIEATDNARGPMGGRPPQDGPKDGPKPEK